MGLGLWKIPKAECANIIYQAIQEGYRYFDSACDYGNEVEVGEGFAKAISDGLCTREDLFITSKLWNTYHQPQHVPQALEKSLSDLGLTYLDSYLIHFPIAQPFIPFEQRYPPEWVFDINADSPTMELAPVPLHETWAAMEALVDAGKVRSIGVCNYNSGLLNDLMAYARIKPAELQIEIHPYLSQTKLVRLAQTYGISVTAFSPLGALSYLELDMAQATESTLENESVKAIAANHNKTPAQVVLRWNVQRDINVITKTTKLARLKENLDVLDFELSDEEMQAIYNLNSNRRFNDPGEFCEAAFNRFYPIYD